jgi:hypothetical protein
MGERPESLLNLFQKEQSWLFLKQLITFQEQDTSSPLRWKNLLKSKLLGKFA